MNSEAGSYFTANELAEALGITVRAAQLRAQAEGWPYIEESLRGGQRRRYLLAGLPLGIAAKVLRRQAADAAAGSYTSWTPPSDFDYSPEELWKEAVKRSAKHREEGEFRARILREVEALMQGEGLPFLKAARRVAASSGRTASSIRKWRYGWKRGERSRRGAKDYAPEDRAVALIPRHAESGRQRKEFPGDMETVFKSLWVNRSGPTVADSYRRTRALAEAEGLDSNAMPSLRTVQSRVKEIPPAVRACGREGERAAINAVPKLRIDRSGLKVGEAVSGDGLTLDMIRARFPDGEVCKPTVWIFQDEKSRCVVGCAIGKTEHTSVFHRALREMCEKFIPRRMTLDNTRVAANKAMTAGAPGRKRFREKPGDPRGLIPRLGIAIHWTDPDKRTINPGAKLCERAFGIGGLHEEVRQHPRIRSIGRSKDEPVPIEQLEAALLEAVQAFNRREGRRDRDSAGRSYERSYSEGMADPGNAVRMLNPYQREILKRLPQKARVHGNAYEVSVRIAPGEAGLIRYTAKGLLDWRGKEVAVLFNPDDLDGDALIQDSEEREICRAERLPDAIHGNTESAGEIQKLKRREGKLSKALLATQGLIGEKQLAQRFSDLPIDPLPEPNVVTADFNPPAAKAVAAGGGHPLDGVIPKLTEGELQHGLELYEKRLKRQRERKRGALDMNSENPAREEIANLPTTCASKRPDRSERLREDVAKLRIRAREAGARRAAILDRACFMERSEGISFSAAAERVAEWESISAESIRVWRKKCQGWPRRDWHAVLATRHGGGAHLAEISAAAWQAFIEDYLRLEAPALAACYRRLRRLAKRHEWQVPKSARTLLRRLEAEFTPGEIALAREGEEVFRRMVPARDRPRPERQEGD